MGVHERLLDNVISGDSFPWKGDVARWHVHPGFKTSYHDFSYGDINIALEYGVPSYVSTYKGILKFNYGDFLKQVDQIKQSEPNWDELMKN